jgi:O-antigen/teichoic acid export membrane protein
MESAVRVPAEGAEPIPFDRSVVGARESPWLRLTRLLALATPSRAAVESVGDQATLSLSNFLTGVIVGRWCGGEQFGLYVLALLVMIGATEVQTSLISAPYTVYRPRLEPSEAREYDGSALLLQFAFAGLTMGTVLIAAAVLGRVGGPLGVAPVLGVLGVVIGGVLVKEHLRRVCFASLRMRSAAILDGSVGSLQVVTLLVLAYLGLLNARTAVAIVAICGCMGAGVWLLVHRRDFSFRWSAALARARAMWMLGRWMSASGVLGHLTTQLTPWLLAALHGATSTALWAVCTNITSAVNPAIFGLANYLTPATAHAYAAGGAPGLRSVVLKASMLFVLAMAPFCLAGVLLGEEVVTFVYGSAYRGTAVVFAIFALTLIPAGLSVVTARGLFALERADLDFKINLVPFVVMLTAGIWSIQRFGVEGGAAAYGAAYVVATVARYWAFGAASRSAPGRGAH